MGPRLQISRPFYEEARQRVPGNTLADAAGTLAAAAQQDNAAAMPLRGRRYASGRGVGQDAPKAIDLIRNAATLGSPGHRALGGRNACARVRADPAAQWSIPLTDPYDCG